MAFTLLFPLPKPVCPGRTHVELIYLSKAAVDDLFGEVIPLHQEHVDLRSKAEAAVLQASGTPHPAVLGEPCG